MPELGTWRPAHAADVKLFDAGMKEAPLLPGLALRPAKLAGIKRWNVETVLPRGTMNVAKYSPDGRWLAIGSADGFVRVLDGTIFVGSFSSAFLAKPILNAKSEANPTTDVMPQSVFPAMSAKWSPDLLHRNRRWWFGNPQTERVPTTHQTVKSVDGQLPISS
ncbi:hypothetical protein [Novipirellula aureliae]|uniref:hypothetical protein n=1 Tax=Novipirellula aureliae TaxID=2527966 RepID=UPI0011B5BFF8|nr:hypothetical protein [Novipirellula aureliae]